MDDLDYIPTSDMHFFEIKKDADIVTITWCHNFFEDYKSLSYQFYECGCTTLNEVINSGHDNVKSDMWFLVGIFLIRHSIELGLKALLCRTLKNRDIENAFESCHHNVYLLFCKYDANGNETYLSDEEKGWLTKYLCSLEEVDKNSDMFRFPFDDDFLSKYNDKFLDNIAVAKNLIQCFELVRKCINKGVVDAGAVFNNKLAASFFVFTSHGIGNCYLLQKISGNEFHTKLIGYTEVIDYIYDNQNISNTNKLYPLVFMFRNTIELYLKCLLYRTVNNGTVSNSKLKSHRIKKDLWRNVKPLILQYAENFDQDLSIVNIVENLLYEMDQLDKRGDKFRYPTSYSFDYYFDNKDFDISNIYIVFKSIENFLSGCNSMLLEVEEFESTMTAEMDGLE